MNDEFYATLKLTTGEEILGYINLFDGGLTILNALLLEDMTMFDDMVDNIHTKGVRLSKWIKSTTDDIQYIKDDKIITICELLEPGLSHYKKAVIDLNRTEQKVNRSNFKKQKYNGHRSTVKEARIKFENLFNEY